MKRNNAFLVAVPTICLVGDCFERSAAIESVHRTSSATLPAVMRRQDGVTLCDGLTADSDVINKFTPTEFTHHRDNSMQKVYIDKLSDSNI